MTGSELVHVTVVKLDVVPLTERVVFSHMAALSFDAGQPGSVNRHVPAHQSGLGRSRRWAAPYDRNRRRLVERRVATDGT